MTRSCLLLAVFLVVLTSSTTSVHAQAPICEVTCTPDLAAPSYPGVAVARRASARRAYRKPRLFYCCFCRSHGGT
jgi:hypothetical protein